jgi:hypothetical protein
MSGKQIPAELRAEMIAAQAAEEMRLRPIVEEKRQIAAELAALAESLRVAALWLQQEPGANSAVRAYRRRLLPAYEKMFDLREACVDSPHREIRAVAKDCTRALKLMRALNALMRMAAANRGTRPIDVPMCGAFQVFASYIAERIEKQVADLGDLPTASGVHH